MAKRIIPDLVSAGRVFSMSKEDTALDAAKLMMERRIGAVAIVSGPTLLGIVTERDLANKIVAGQRDAATTTLAQIMTRDPDTIEPGASVMTALQLMQARGYRHLPVVEDGKILAMVSIRDVYAAVRSDLEEEVLEREAFISGAGYGGVN